MQALRRHAALGKRTQRRRGTIGVMNSVPSPSPPAPAPADLPFSAAAERNAPPILQALSSWLAPQARVLEVASGTGQHAAHFAKAQPGWQWQPSGPDPATLPAMAARCAGLSNVRPPLPLDVLQDPWPVDAAAGAGFDAVYCANMLHIAPWPVTAAYFRGAAACLGTAGVVVVYGPFIVDGEPVLPSNAAFDADLRGRNPLWGLRRLAEVAQAAADAGLVLQQRLAMPANNLLLRFGRGPSV
jgi:SAM-dependent methyltransferase